MLRTFGEVGAERGVGPHRKGVKQKGGNKTR